MGRGVYTKQNFSTISKGWGSTLKSKGKGSKGFSSDEVITAYIKGKEFANKQIDESKTNTLKANIRKSIECANKVIELLKKESFSPKSAYMRIASQTFEKFDVLITLSEKEFLSDKLLLIYDSISKIEDKLNSNSYHISFSFTDAPEQFNEPQVQTDGFILKHPIS